MKKITMFLSAIICFSLYSNAVDKKSYPEYFNETEKKFIREALEVLNMSDSDLSFSKKPVIDEFWMARYEHVLEMVDYLMTSPLEVPSYSGYLVKSMEKNSLLDNYILLANQIDVSLSSHEVNIEEAHAKDEFIKVLSEEKKKEFKSLPVEVQESLAILYFAVKDSNDLIKKAFSQLSNQEINSIKTRPDESVEGILQAWNRIDKKSLYLAGAKTIRAVEIARNKLKKINSGQTQPSKEGILFSFDSEFGPITVGGKDNTTYSKSPAISIDLAGNDIYQESDGPLPVSVIIDLNGNDVYESEAFCQGAGFMGVGILVDERGDDHYKAKMNSQGSGLLGIGVLLDNSGNDYYEGDSECQGTGSFGIGMLIDNSGDDRYFSCVCSQGYGFIRGIGVISDISGNDAYYAGGKYSHKPLLPDRYRSMSQGCGFGARFRAGGGIGLLADYDGSDSYYCDVFGQGVGYWLGLGILYDKKGNDVYNSTIYSQGSGIHLAIGALIDEAGEDCYTACHGVTQGAGHDYAIGFLVDRAGNDRYMSAGFAQGAADENSVAFLIDSAGDDIYAAERDDCQGSGVPCRGTCSMGFLIDVDGKNGVMTHKKNMDVTYFPKRDMGLIIDYSASGVEPPKKDDTASQDDLQITDFSMEGLFQTASLWEVGTNRKAVLEARQKLVEKGDEAISFLIENKMASTGIYQIRALITVFSGIGKASVKPLINCLSSRNPNIKRNAVEILGSINDTESTSALIEALKDEDGIKAKSLISLGRLKAKEAVPRIIQLLNSNIDEHLRIVAIQTLGEIKDEQGILPMIEWLKNGSFTVRYAIYKSLTGMAGASVKPLLALLDSNISVKTRLDAIWILGEIKSEECYETLMRYVKDEDYRTRAYAIRALGKFKKPGFLQYLSELEKTETHPFVKSIITLAKQ